MHKKSCGYIRLEDLSNIDMQMVNLKTIKDTAPS